MRLKLFLLLLLAAWLPSIAQTVRVQGSVVDASTGAPIKGAVVTLRDQSLGAQSGAAGDFIISGAGQGTDFIIIDCDGYEPVAIDVNLPNVRQFEIGEIRLNKKNAVVDEFTWDLSDMLFDESALEDDEGNSQNIAALTGANDNLYYNTASYNFGPMYFRYRGYDSRYQMVYLNGMPMNDLIRGRFNFSSLLGLTSRAFRNKSTTVGLDAALYGFGDIGGSVNYNTITENYAPGTNASVAFTNSNYMWRALVQYSTGMSKTGWAFSVAAIGRYAKEGVIEGTFYNSAGLFLSLEKRLNNHNSLTLTAFGGPTQRAGASATYQEAYDLAGSNTYNPNWGWYQGKKRASRITETFDPTLMLTWLYKKGNTTLTTSATARWVRYNSAAFNYYKANDPNPTYYRYLPSYYKDYPEEYELYTDLWENSEYMRQVKWDEIYQVNELNNQHNIGKSDDEKIGASYIQENRHSNQFVTSISTYLNQRLNRYMTLQAGAFFNWTNGSYYKTIRDLLGGEFWVDIDPFSDRDITLAPDNLQNDLDNPNRRVYKGDKFGYDYNFYALKGQAWIQNMVNLPRVDFYYGLQIAYTQYQREGHMRNGRAPYNSLGKGKMHRYDDAMIKAGATFKLDGRNFLLAHATYGTQAPIMENIYVSPRVSDAASDAGSERVFSGDLSYNWNYRRFRGSIAAYYTSVANATERLSFYDDRYATYTNFVLSDVKRVYSGFEVGMAYKITPSISVTFAGTYAKYQYKNNPQGTRSFENGLYADTTQTVYLKNYHVGSVPQTVLNLGIDWVAPKLWFININGTWQGQSYVNISPTYHEALPDLWQICTTQEELEAKLADLSKQDKLRDAFSLNLSIGKLMYIQRKYQLNFNLSINNILNNRNVCTYAYQQSRMNTSTYDRSAYPNKYTYAQGIRVYVNVGFKF
ncbi:MAG: TonB-dependent receptor [Bacteroidales bacterium]|nr:TonB-dependent receptor [Bacteroidales bacterium]